MSLEQASFLAQIISALAIIASLIFVGVQLRQATTAMRNSSSQAHSAIYSEVISTIIANGEFASIWRRGLKEPESLNEDEWVRFIACASAQFRFFESSRVQWLRGHLDDEHWQNIEAQANSLLRSPGSKRGGSFGETGTLRRSDDGLNPFQGLMEVGCTKPCAKSGPLTPATRRAS